MILFIYFYAFFLSNNLEVYIRERERERDKVGGERKAIMFYIIKYIYIYL